MAAGDAVTAWVSVGSGNFLDVKPGAGAEWAIFLFEAAAEMEIYKTDGTTPGKIVPAGTVNVPTVVGSGAGPFRATNAIYYRIKNVNAGTQMCGYSGTQTK
jgi:hypothetical protein